MAQVGARRVELDSGQQAQDEGLGVQPHMGVLPESSCEGVGLGSGLSPYVWFLKLPDSGPVLGNRGRGVHGQTPKGVWRLDLG